MAIARKIRSIPNQSLITLSSRFANAPLRHYRSSNSRHVVFVRFSIYEFLFLIFFVSFLSFLIHCFSSLLLSYVSVELAVAQEQSVCELPKINKHWAGGCVVRIVVNLSSNSSITFTFPVVHRSAVFGAYPSLWSSPSRCRRSLTARFSRPCHGSTSASQVAITRPRETFEGKEVLSRKLVLFLVLTSVVEGVLKQQEAKFMYFIIYIYIPLRCFNHGVIPSNVWFNRHSCSKNPIIFVLERQEGL